MVELDGEAWHRDGRLRDMRRDNIHLLAGELTLRYGWHDVLDRSCTVAIQVPGLLQRQGRSGCLQACPKCPGTSTQASASVRDPTAISRLDPGMGR